MKLQCQVEVVNRLDNQSKGKYLKSTLALGKEPKKKKEYFIIHFSSSNKTGTKYRVANLKRVFHKCLNEGKTTIRFDEPPHDLCIKCEAIQLKCFMKLLKQCITGDTENLQLPNLSNLSVVGNSAPTKLVIHDRSEFPSSGLPRTLKSLRASGLKIFNFRPEILCLKHLSILDLSSNEILKLPPALGQMNISELYLANNQIGINGEVDWRWLFGPQIINSLRLLDLSGNSFTHIPQNICRLGHLVTLKFDNNKLIKLPSTVCRMANLRYLTISKNKLVSLPCGMMYSRIEHIDISSNQFNYVVPFLSNNTMSWEFGVESLVDIASKAVVKHKLYYAPNIIPYTLTQSLDCYNICVCGAAVMNERYLPKRFEIKQYFRSLVFDGNESSSVPFECYFCSAKCMNKVRVGALITSKR